MATQTSRQGLSGGPSTRVRQMHSSQSYYSGAGKRKLRWCEKLRDWKAWNWEMFRDSRTLKLEYGKRKFN
uniref:Uncharacterized protein n=1 Tax=Vitis vinifera TaxID=29760 RepID=F6HNG5_VITVI